MGRSRIYTAPPHSRVKSKSTAEGRCFQGLNVEQAHDSVTGRHEDDVENPDDVPAQEQAEDTGNDLTLGDTRNNTANQGGNRNNCQNQTDE